LPSLPKTIAINAPDRVSAAGRAADAADAVFVGPFSSIVEGSSGIDADARVKIGHNQHAVADRAPARRGRPASPRGKVKSRTATCSAACSTMRELQVSDVMVHRTEMVMINADLPPEDLVRRVWPPK